jgi:hypothetical protein
MTLANIMALVPQQRKLLATKNPSHSSGVKSLSRKLSQKQNSEPVSWQNVNAPGFEVSLTRSGYLPDHLGLPINKI